MRTPHALSTVELMADYHEKFGELLALRRTVAAIFAQPWLRIVSGNYSSLAGERSEPEFEFNSKTLGDDFDGRLRSMLLDALHVQMAALETAMIEMLAP